MKPGTSRYDTIGRSYSSTRLPDPRIAAQITAALGAAERIVNVGAGTGSYEPTDRFVVAGDPSLTMLRQRAASAGSAVRLAAECLPFPDDSFDAALATLTLHHWSDIERGLREMQRVARRQVILFFDPASIGDFWLVEEYFPEILDLGSEKAAPDGARLAETLTVQRIEPVPVPDDCSRRFRRCLLEPARRRTSTRWCRPGSPRSRNSTPEVCERGTERLRRDLADGTWDARHGHLRSLTEIDFGYRLLVAGPLS